MSNYTSTYTKITGNDIEVSDFSTEFDAIEAASLTKADKANDTITGATLTTATITSGQFNQLNDTNNNESLILTPTASAVNEITLANAATGNSPTFTASGDDTNINVKIAGKGTGGLIVPLDLLDTNGNEVISHVATASAVNELTITNGATTEAVDLSATGDDTDINLSLTPKGAGWVENNVQGALVTDTSDQAIGYGNWAHINWDSETGGYDTNSIHDTSTNNQRLTVPSGVTYIKLKACLNFTATSSCAALVVFSKNDETTNPTSVIGMPRETMSVGTVFTAGMSLSSPPINVTSGDYFTVAVYCQDAGATATLTVDMTSAEHDSWFAMEIIK